ncbi:hypothetical protein [Chitinophaga sp.]|uniref:hypothetical protein n=1 Tax=Chitinophaga sp. TaxID=1869181 RepID=UPI0031CE64E3
MKKTNEQLENPVGDQKEQAFDDQRNKASYEGDQANENEENDADVNDDEEEDGSPILDEADLEENDISEDDAESIEWGPEGKKGGKQNITNAADTGSNNKGTDDDNRTGSNTMRTDEPPIK